MILFGFGFNFLMILVIMPLTVILTLIWAITRKAIFGKMIGVIWGGLFVLLALIIVVNIFTTKLKLTKEKIYGEYIIDRDKYPGQQANWQYENFKFKITTNNIMHFSYKISDNNFKTEQIPVKILEQYYSDRLEIGKDSTRHHIIVDNPTLYRNVWNFNYVFKSDKFGNVFFKKRKWYN